MVYIGYRKGVVKKGYAGMRFCEHCNLITQHYVYENSFRPTIMFIAVAKFNKSYMIGCGNCERGYEIEEDIARQIIQKATMIPKEKLFSQLYFAIESKLKEIDPETNKPWTNKVITTLLGDESKKDEVLEYLLRQLGDAHTGSDIKTVFYYYINAQLMNPNFI